MTTHNKMIATALAAVLALAAASTARADEEDERRTVGIGYKIGNGMGLAGADVIVRAIPHVSLDVQASYLGPVFPAAEDSPSGYGLVPALQFQLNDVGHTPYFSVGFLYAHMSNSQASASADGGVFNLGYEWRCDCHIAFMIGGGLGVLHMLHGERSAYTAAGLNSHGNGAFLNVETGFRYFF